jgi:transposase
MNPYPAKHSVLVMDNARIHHDDNLVTAIEDIGGRVLYLPPYSPDFNLIETAFSALKSWLKRYRDLVNNFDPIYLILVALAQTTPEMAKEYFKESVYDV